MDHIQSQCGRQVRASVQCRSTQDIRVRVAGPASDQLGLPWQLLLQDVATGAVGVANNNLSGARRQCTLTRRDRFRGHPLRELRIVRVQLGGLVLRHAAAASSQHV